jgi:hypothetical protein
VRDASCLFLLLNYELPKVRLRLPA